MPEEAQRQHRLKYLKFKAESMPYKLYYPETCEVRVGSAVQKSTLERYAGEVEQKSEFGDEADELPEAKPAPPVS